MDAWVGKAWGEAMGLGWERNGSQQHLESTETATATMTIYTGTRIQLISSHSGCTLGV